MSRSDAVNVVLEIVARMRALEPRLKVTYENGWQSRGNGLSARYQGGIWHHTASVSSLANPFPTRNILRDGRPDLEGPLCNFAGPACTVDAPWIHVMAAYPANHAGASGGRSMGPLPTTSLFNPVVLGLEIDYAGSSPMMDGQAYAAHLWGRAVADVLAGGDIEYVRAHAETSVTGKWDPGYAPGRTIDMGAFRRDAAAVEDDDFMALFSNLDEFKTAVRDATLNVRFERQGLAATKPGQKPEDNMTTLGTWVGWLDNAFIETQGEVAALTELVKQLITAQGATVDLAAVEAAAKAGAQAALEQAVKVDVTVGGA